MLDTKLTKHLPLSCSFFILFYFGRRFLFPPISVSSVCLHHPSPYVWSPGSFNSLIPPHSWITATITRLDAKSAPASSRCSAMSKVPILFYFFSAPSRFFFRFRFLLHSSIFSLFYCQFLPPFYCSVFFKTKTNRIDFGLPNSAAALFI